MRGGPTSDHDELGVRVQASLDALTKSVPGSTIPAFSPSKVRPDRSRQLMFGSMGVVGALLVGALAFGIRRSDGETSVVSGTEPTADTARWAATPALANVSDATVLYLPSELPDDWYVWEAYTGESNDLDWEESGPPHDVDPPLAPGSWREHHVDFGPLDLTRRFDLSIVETPTDLSNFDVPVSISGLALDLDGFRVVRTRLDPNSYLRPIPHTWEWVLDGRRMTLKATVLDDEFLEIERVIASMRRVSGTELAGAIAEGQAALRSLPAVGVRSQSDRLALQPRGRNGVVETICMESPIDLCTLTRRVSDAPHVELIGGRTSKHWFAWLPLENLDQFGLGQLDGLIVAKPGGGLLMQGRSDLKQRPVDFDPPSLLSLLDIIALLPTPVGIAADTTDAASAKPLVEIPDASIFFLPSPLPQGWHAWEAIQSGDLGDLDWDEPEGPAMEAVPPIPPGVFREFSVQLGRDDEAVVAVLRVVETPTYLTDSATTETRPAPPGSGPFMIDGIPRYRYGDDASSAWGWIQDGHDVRLEFWPALGEHSERELVASVKQVPGREIAYAIAEGQIAARVLPELVSNDAGGFAQSARGLDGTVITVCIEEPVPVCRFRTAPYAELDADNAAAIVYPIDRPDGTYVYGWLPEPYVRSALPTVDLVSESSRGPLRQSGALVLVREPNFEQVGPPPDSTDLPCALFRPRINDPGFECVGVQGPHPNLIGLPPEAAFRRASD